MPKCCCSTWRVTFHTCLTIGPIPTVVHLLKLSSSMGRSFSHSLNCLQLLPLQDQRAVWPNWSIFLKVLVTFFHTKVAQNNRKRYGLFWKHNFYSKNRYVYFLDHFWKKWLLFYFNIWSHCQQVDVNLDRHWALWWVTFMRPFSSSKSL